ncbi:hypothetical protein N7492_001087, partial [Penicillium capsulatum]
MNHPPFVPDAQIKTVGLREICENNGRHFYRRKGTQQWIEYTPETPSIPASNADSPLYLSLVLEEQGPREPFHWSLLVARGSEPGFVYQVHGDAEYMIYEPSDGPVDIVNSECFSNLYQLATVSEEQGLVVNEVAQKEPPPRAPDRRSVTENCQGWVVRVIEKLVERGIVLARSMLEPLQDRGGS